MFLRCLFNDYVPFEFVRKQIEVFTLTIALFFIFLITFLLSLTCKLAGTVLYFLWRYHAKYFSPNLEKGAFKSEMRRGRKWKAFALEGVAKASCGARGDSTMTYSIKNYRCRICKEYLRDPVWGSGIGRTEKRKPGFSLAGAIYSDY